VAAVGLPKPKPLEIEKASLLEALVEVDNDEAARKRVLAMETEFRFRIDAAVASLPADTSTLQRLGTSPYVLLFYSRQKGFTRISEIEASIIPAKVFSSMETSAGRMIEQVALPVYGWECIASEMQTANSALDGRKTQSDTVEVATLKSGPRCLNDEMTDNFADAILNHASEWAADGNSDHVEFTYGVLYGTMRQSNKKDWHILRKVSEKARSRGATMLVEPVDRWDCGFEFADTGVRVDVVVRIGMDWWRHLGGDGCAMELWTALIRACITPGESDVGAQYSITDLAAIVSTDQVPSDYNVSLLQESQLPWLFFVARHFCDALT
jgi:Type II restriction endonuclease EcoO109I